MVSLIITLTRFDANELDKNNLVERAEHRI